jgi:hypothetical protein
MSAAALRTAAVRFSLRNHYEGLLRIYEEAIAA